MVALAFGGSSMWSEIPRQLPFERQKSVYVSIVVRYYIQELSIHI